jgi:tetratricopeptide (TPR) repeat protein
LIGADEEGTLERLRAHRRELIDSKIAEHQGRIVKSTGDGLLVEFASPVKAVRCAIEVQHGMADRNADVPQEQQLEFRIGINLGDVIVEEGDIYGDGVNVAARLEGIAEPGAVYISRAVRDFVDNKPEIVLEDLGEKPLKNIAKPVQVFRIGAPDRAVRAPQVAGPPLVPHKPSIAVLPFTNMSGDAERFDRELTDIFSTQDEVVEKIVGALAVTLTQGEERRLRRHGTGSVEAYESWLRARECLTRGTRESVAPARVMYRRAIEIDLNFARPHAGLALAAISDYVSGWAPDPAQALDEAARWARRAIELNDQEPVSHMALGNVLLWRRDHDGALREFGRMIELDPNFAQGHAATGMALTYAGRPAEALESIALATRLDPHYPSIMLHFVGQAHFSLEHYETAAELLLERIARTPGTDSSRMLLASCYGHLGRAQEAQAAWEELLKVNPEFSLSQRERVLPFKDASDFRRIVDGLAKAGLP